MQEFLLSPENAKENQGCINSKKFVVQEEDSNHFQSPSCPLKVFISYADQDEKLRQEFENTCLSVLIGKQVIDVWHKGKTRLGSDRSAKIAEHIASCQVFLPLISPAYVSSYYHKEKSSVKFQIDETLRRKTLKEQKILIIPIIFTDVIWESLPLNNYQELPRNGNPVDSRKWYKRNNALMHIAKEIELEIINFFR